MSIALWTWHVPHLTYFTDMRWKKLIAMLQLQLRGPTENTQCTLLATRTYCTQLVMFKDSL